MKKFLMIIIVCCIGAGCLIGAYSIFIPEAQAMEQIKIKKRCKTCNGTGKMTIKKTHGPCAGKGCPGCDYNGYVITKVDCSSCGGTGWIQVN